MAGVLCLIFLLVQEDGNTIVVDTGVYTRNRAFRLFLSSKAGKTSILTSTGREFTMLVQQL